MTKEIENRKSKSGDLRAPLRLEPLIVPKPWGGRALERLGKRLPAGVPCGESWEVSPLPGKETRVATGPLTGRTLDELVGTNAGALLGKGTTERRFPLLFKFLHAQQALSVQLHPSIPPDEEELPKSEAWTILEAAPQARVHIGPIARMDPEEFRAACEDGSVAGLLRAITVRAGDVFFLSPGTLHSIGPGILLAEIQQRSDTTYRVHDWGRVGLDGRPRPLHIVEATRSARLRPVDDAELRPGGDGGELLFATPDFSCRRLRGTEAFTFSTDGRLAIASALSGSCRVHGPEGSETMTVGTTLLLPACVESWEVEVEAPLDLLVHTRSVR